MPDGDFDTRATEVSFWHLGRRLHAKSWDTPDQIDRHFKDLLKQHQGKIPPLPPRNPTEEAQQLMYEAFALTATRDRVAMAKRAMEKSKDCADAYVLLAEDEATTPAKRVALYRKGVSAGERFLGDEMIDKNMGELWGWVEARPFLRAKLGLAEALLELPDPIEALKEYVMLMLLDKGDHQGARYTLVLIFIVAEMFGDAAYLMDRKDFSKDDDPGWLFTRALLTYAQMGDIHAARVDLDKAFTADREAGLQLAGVGTMKRRTMTNDEVERLEDSIQLADELNPSWTSVDGALSWLRTCLTSTPP